MKEKFKLNQVELLLVAGPLMVNVGRQDSVGNLSQYLLLDLF
jgi:hypothetical protein